MILTTLLTLGDALACDTAVLRNALGAAEAAFRTAQSVKNAPHGKELAAPAETALVEVHRAVACFSEPVDPPVAARVHLTEALTAWLADDRPRALAGLKAMLSADPTYDPPLVLLAADHPLRLWMTLAGEDPVIWSPELKKWALVDGLPSRAVPQGQPYILQRPKGSGMHGEWVTSAPVRSNRGPWMIAGGALGATAGGLFAGAWVTRSAYWDAVDARDNDQIGSLHTTTNALSIGSVGAAALAAGAITLGVVL